MKQLPGRWACTCALVLWVGFGASCGLEQDIELELPEYTPGAAVEGYLTPGRPFGLLLTNSVRFFDTLTLDVGRLIEEISITNADVRIRYGTEEVVLTEGLVFDPKDASIFNYTSTQLVPENYIDSFFLDIVLEDGSRVSAATKLLPAVTEIDERINYGTDQEGRPRASVVTLVQDPDPSKVNYFRKIVTFSPLDSMLLQDFVVNDELTDQELVSLGTTDFEFMANDTVYVFVTHVEEAFEDYITSLLTATASNGNPLAQPSTILSNVEGEGIDAIGIFSSYAYVIDTLVIPEP